MALQQLNEEQIRTWTGLDPPVELMERVVRTALEAKDRLQGPE